MSDLFYEVASIDYPIIDSDAHVNEPPNLWQERVAARLKHRAPKVLHQPDGDVWSFDDGKKIRPVGLTATRRATRTTPSVPAASIRSSASKTWTRTGCMHK